MGDWLVIALVLTAVGGVGWLIGAALGADEDDR